MTEQASNYTMGYSEEFRQLLNRRSMETHAGYLLPYLKPGLRVLDFGCGPGTILGGLGRGSGPRRSSRRGYGRVADRTGPSSGRRGGHDNAVFHVGDVTSFLLRQFL